MCECECSETKPVKVYIGEHEVTDEFCARCEGCNQHAETATMRGIDPTLCKTCQVTVALPDDWRVLRAGKPNEATTVIYAGGYAMEGMPDGWIEVTVADHNGDDRSRHVAELMAGWLNNLGVRDYTSELFDRNKRADETIDALQAAIARAITVIDDAGNREVSAQDVLTALSAADPQEAAAASPPVRVQEWVTTQRAAGWPNSHPEESHLGLALQVRRAFARIRAMS